MSRVSASSGLEASWKTLARRKKRNFHLFRRRSPVFLAHLLRTGGGSHGLARFSQAICRWNSVLSTCATSHDSRRCDEKNEGKSRGVECRLRVLPTTASCVHHTWPSGKSTLSRAVKMPLTASPASCCVLPSHWTSSPRCEAHAQWVYEQREKDWSVLVRVSNGRDRIVTSSQNCAAVFVEHGISYTPHRRKKGG